MGDTHVSQPPPKPYTQGTLETRKFDARRGPYWESIQRIIGMGYEPADLIHHAPAFAGHMNIGRHLALYEAYKLTLPFAGHIAEAGMYLGTSSIYFAKLTQLFEPAALTLVLGFDWFQGAQGKGDEAHLVSEGAYAESYDRVCELIRVQGLDNIIRVNNLDLTRDLPAYFREHDHLQFKLVFLDCGYYDVVKPCIEEFWPRLTPGGVLLLDNFNHETAPGEARAVRELLPDRQIRTFNFAFQPTAYIIK
ncbi:MAG: class I SAM-dependent methyltransferase [Candidatus Aquilonibacter sp.]|jgi:predicted O-methyltransferase YrrM